MTLKSTSFHKPILELISSAQSEFKSRMEQMENCGGLTAERYTRYLSMQYHLTKGVQRHFMICASHPDFSHKLALREFLFKFALEEELHFKIAEKDLENLGTKALPKPFDVELWWSYFDGIVYDKPLVRLGATCILENISSSSGALIQNLMKQASYLNAKNTKFITIHQHGPNLDHGNEILEALHGADLNTSQWNDVETGARNGTLMYLRMADWALQLPAFTKLKTAA